MLLKKKTIKIVQNKKMQLKISNLANFWGFFVIHFTEFRSREIHVHLV